MYDLTVDHTPHTTLRGVYTAAILSALSSWIQAPEKGGLFVEDNAGQSPFKRFKEYVSPQSNLAYDEYVRLLFIERHLATDGTALSEIVV